MSEPSQQKYLPWSPVSGDLNDKIVDELLDCDEGLIIRLRGPKKRSVRTSKILQVCFDPYIAYRNMDESFRSRTWQRLKGVGCNFYVVENSEWLRWFQEESLHIYEDREIVHYAIYSIADCIDVLSEFPPAVSWVNVS